MYCTVHSHTIHRIAAVIEVYVCGVCVCVFGVIHYYYDGCVTFDLFMSYILYNLYVPHTCTHTHTHCHYSAWSIILKHLCMC